MKALTRLPIICTWILLVLLLSEFAFIAYMWLSYCPPTAAARFAFNGVWFKEEFQYYRHAGIALDQPTVGKFFLWTSVMSCLACTIILLLHTVVDVSRRVARRCVNVCTVLLVAVMLTEFLAPTFLLVQYVLSMGFTIRRALGLCLCCGFWILLPTVVFWIRKANPALMKWTSSPITWALACSLVAPTYYLSVILHSSVWRYWTTEHTTLMIAWLVLVAQIPCIMWLRAWRKPRTMNHDMEHCRTIASTMT